jgi:hypothetical protein
MRLVDTPYGGPTLPAFRGESREGTEIPPTPAEIL